MATLYPHSSQGIVPRLLGLLVVFQAINVACRGIAWFGYGPVSHCFIDSIARDRAKSTEVVQWDMGCPTALCSAVGAKSSRA